MGGDVGRVGLGIMTGGLSEVANLATGNKIYGKKDKKPSVLAEPVKPLETPASQPYGANKMRNARLSMYESPVFTFGEEANKNKQTLG